MLSWFLLSLLFISTSAKTSNATVDDSTTNRPTTSGAFIQYSNVGNDPNNKWRSSSEPCDVCSAKPRADLAHNGTWHDVTYDPTIKAHVPQSASFSFQGTGVYVYFILPLTTGIPNGHVSCSFALDGETVKNYTWDPPRSEGYLYDQLVFSQSNLTNSTHTLVINNDASDGKRSLILLDKIVWTGDDGLPDETEGIQRKTGISTSAIVGIVVGAILLPIAVGILTAWFIRRRKRQDPNLHKEGRDLEATEIDPSSPSTPFISRRPIDLYPRNEYPTKSSASGSGRGSSIGVVPPPAYAETESEVISVYSRIRGL